MNIIIKKNNVDVDSIKNKLWMSERNLKQLNEKGHIIGLHSYNHPYKMSKLTFNEQLNEYQKNYDHLNKIVGKIFSMSHPCGDYNEDTLKILSYLGLKIGFNSSYSEKKIKNQYEVPVCTKIDFNFV